MKANINQVAVLKENKVLENQTLAQVADTIGVLIYYCRIEILLS
jgi:hypothetical protein